ncbi:hypothetical protein GCM10009674_03940 [Nesterenkonia xinjiangensis]
MPGRASDGMEEQLISDVGLDRRHQLVACLAGVGVALPALAWGWSTASALPVLGGILLACVVFAWSSLLRVRLSVVGEGLRLRAGIWSAEIVPWQAVQQIRTGARTQLIAVWGRKSEAEATQYLVDGPTLRIVTSGHEYVVSVEDSRAAMQELSAHWPGEHTLRTLDPQQRST